MNTEMKNKLAPYYDAETDRYDLHRLQAGMGVDDDAMYDFIYEGMEEPGTEPYEPSPEMAAAMAYNDERDMAERGLSADEVYDRVINGPNGAAWIETHTTYTSDAEKRKLARMFYSYHQCNPGTNILAFTLPYIVFSDGQQAGTPDYMTDAHMPGLFINLNLFEKPELPTANNLHRKAW